MTQRASDSLVAVLIRIGLLLALAILLMAENAQAKPLTPSSWFHRTFHRTTHTTSGRTLTRSPASQQRRNPSGGTRNDRKA